MKTFKRLVLCLAAATTQLSAAAVPIIDQGNPGTANASCGLTIAMACGQSLLADQFNISGAGIYIDPARGVRSNGTLKLSAFSDYVTGGPSGLVASATASNVNVDSKWVDVFWKAVPLTAGLRYFLVAESSYQIAAAYGNAAYAAGNALYNGSQSQFSMFDLTFRTYYENAPSQPVPAPGSLSLMVLGLAGLAFALRKKRAYY